MHRFSFITNWAPPRNRTPNKFIASSSFPNSKRAIVSQTIAKGKCGRIYYQATYWFACAENDAYIPEGTAVEVLQRDGTTWLVKPMTTNFQIPAP